MECVILEFPARPTWGREAAFQAFEMAEREMAEVGPHLDMARAVDRDRWSEIYGRWQLARDRWMEAQREHFYRNKEGA